MSLITSAATTATTTATTGVVTRALTFAWDHTAAHVFYIIDFDDNQDALATRNRELRARKVDVQNQVDYEEANQRTRTSEVDEWLRSVETTLQEADTILQDGSQQNVLRCIADCSPTTWWTFYKLGKQTRKTLDTVDRLISKGKFDVVANKFVPSRVQIVNQSHAAEMDDLFNDAWSLLGQEDVKIMGIYGMGGVGKTTLLEKINNAFHQEDGKKFDVVIFVVVSKEFSIKKVQKRIGKRLRMEWAENEDQDEVAVRIFTALSEKKFVVLLDDLWQYMDLKSIGIPIPQTHRLNSKVVFTTRSEQVCGDMGADKRFRVPVLDPNRAWKLFKQNLGREALDSHPELLELAMDVADECRGLPLALLTVSRAMSTKKSIPEWERAIDTLKRYAYEFSGMEEKVLAPLKFSYDSLENDTLRKCLLYCSLYGEDSSIDVEELVEQWIGEGFLDESKNLDEARRQGHDIIGSLKAACLLESIGCSFSTNMHDIVRDMALWIARDEGKKKNKTVVEAYAGLTEAPDMEIWKDAERVSRMRSERPLLLNFLAQRCPLVVEAYAGWPEASDKKSWKDAERVSLMGDDITELPKVIQSPCLLTLLLQRCTLLSRITSAFFQYMPLLRVLNLSFTGIRIIPNSIGDLAELRYLNLANTYIVTLPKELANLSKLRLLDLSGTLYLKLVPRGVIARLFSIRSLNLYNGWCHPYATEEAESLRHLEELHIRVKDFSGLSERLRSCLKSIVISECLPHFQLAPFLLRENFKGLKDIAIGECMELEELQIDFVKTDHNSKKLFFNLENFRLVNLPKLNKLWTAGTANHGHFKKLHTVSICHCDALKEMSWLVQLPFLRRLYISDCKEIEEILGDEGLAGPSVGNQSRFSDCKEIEEILVAEGLAGPSVGNQSVFSRVESLYLLNLPKLLSISRVALSFPSLTYLKIERCPLLKKLPFTSNSTNKSSLKILGETEWWGELEWEDETVKTFFQSSFYPIEFSSLRQRVLPQ